MLRPGDEPISGYRLESFLGRGQFGEVWKTTSPGGGSAALKFLDLTGKEGRKELRGIQQVKAIRHANLMPITALWLLDEDGDILNDDALRDIKPERSVEDTLVPGDVLEPADRPRWLVVAQLLGEKTLGDELEHYKEQGESGIPVEALLTHMEEAAKGIDYLNGDRHDLGEGLFAVQHCDIKPDNMLLVGGSVMICDFGLAHIMRSDTAARTTGMPGSPAFIAPECIDQRPTATSDQYSLAISYYELRTGDFPFADQSPVGALDAHRNGKLEFGKLPSDEATVVAKATSLNPEQRYATCLEFVRALQQAAGVHTVPALADTRASKWSWIFPAVTTVILVAALFATLFWGRGNNTTTEHEFRIIVTPAESELKIDGDIVQLIDGQVDLQRPPADAMNLVVSHGPDYEVQSRRVPVQDHSIDSPLTITLARSARYLSGRADRLLDAGNYAEATTQLSDAIKKDARFATFPKPILFLDVDPNGLGQVTQFDITPDGAWVVAGFKRGAVAKWKTDSIARSPAPPRTQHHHQGMVEALVTAGSWVASADNQQTVIVSNLSNASRAATFSLGTFGRIPLGISSRGDFVLTGSDYQLKRWDRDLGGSFSETFLGTHEDKIEAIQVADNDRAVITASWDGSVQRWQADKAAPPTPLGKLGDGGQVFTIAQSRSNIAFAGDEPGGANRVYLVPVAGGGSVQSMPESLRSPVSTLQFGPSGDLLAAGTDDDGRVSVWQRDSNTDRWQRIPLPNQHSDSVTSLAFPNSKYLISAGNDGSVVIWDLASQENRVTVLASGLAPITRIRVTRDGRWLLALSLDGRLRLWDLSRCLLIKRASDKAGTKSRDPNQTSSLGVEA